MTEITVKFSFKAKACKDGRHWLTEPGVMDAIAKTIAEHGYSLGDYSSPRMVGERTIPEEEL